MADDRHMNLAELNMAVMDAEIALEALGVFGIERSEYECLHETLRTLLPEFKLAVERDPSHAVYVSLVERIEAVVRPERYRYERYSDSGGMTQWDRRVQWLVFDRQSVGCMMSLGTEREAALTVAAMNAFTLTEDANAFQPEAWHNRVRDERIASETCPDCYGAGVIEGELCPMCKGRRP